MLVIKWFFPLFGDKMRWGFNQYRFLPTAHENWSIAVANSQSLQLYMKSRFASTKFGGPAFADLGTPSWIISLGQMSQFPMKPSDTNFKCFKKNFWSFAQYLSLTPNYNRIKMFLAVCEGGRKSVRRIYRSRGSFVIWNRSQDLTRKIFLSFSVVVNVNLGPFRSSVKNRSWSFWGFRPVGRRSSRGRCRDKGFPHVKGFWRNYRNFFWLLIYISFFWLFYVWLLMSTLFSPCYYYHRLLFL